MMDLKDSIWVEKYRPHKIEDCVLPDRLKSVFLSYITEGKMPNLILTGTAGVGKTTVAKALFEEIGYEYIMLNGSEENGIDTLRGKVKTYASSVSLSGSRKAIIFDEADYLTASAQAALRGLMEEFADNCSFVLTCNYKNRLIDPIHSRCAVVDFKLAKEEKAQMAMNFMKRLVFILTEEKIKFEKKDIVQLINKFFPDYRRIINELQRHSAGGTIASETISDIGDTKLAELVTFLKSKKYNEIRKWVAQNSECDAIKLFREIYDRLVDILTPQSVPIAVVLLGKYQFQAAFCSDQEINLMALLTELFVECEFK